MHLLVASPISRVLVIVWDLYDMYANVLWALQWCHEVKIVYIDCHEPISFYRDDAVEEDFDNEHICCGCGYFTWVVYFSSVCGESCSVLFFIFWS